MLVYDAPTTTLFASTLNNSPAAVYIVWMAHSICCLSSIGVSLSLSPFTLARVNVALVLVVVVAATAIANATVAT